MRTTLGPDGGGCVPEAFNVLDEDGTTKTGPDRGVWRDLLTAPTFTENPPRPPQPPLVTFHARGVTFWQAAIAPDERVTLDGSIRRLFILRSREHGDRI